MRRLSALIILAAAFVTAASFYWNQPTFDPAPFRVAPYLQFGTDSSMVVMWETETPATTRVDFGQSRLGDSEPNLSRSEEIAGTRTLHEVVLTGLEQGTKYFWQVVSADGTGDTLRNDPSTFRTTVSEGSAFAFVLYGDSQSNPETWARVAELGWLERPNFALLAGDLVDKGGNIDDWLVEFFPPANVLMSRVPMYTAIGNHEEDHENYYRYMHNPPPENYYSFRYANADFFIVDTNKDVTEGSEQYEWLEQALATSTAMWKFVMHHHPPYSSEENDHGDSWVGSTTYGTHARNLVPLYEAYGVDFCLFGHVHMYERTWPLLEDAINQENGVIYINSGGAGGGLEQFAPTRSWFSAKLKSVHHYTYFSIHQDRLYYQAIDENGALFDSFELTKDPARIARAQVAKPPAPRVLPAGTVFMDEVTVELSGSLEDLDLYYTLDGSEPTAASTPYSGPIEIEGSTQLKTIAYSSDGVESRVRTEVYRRASPRPAVEVSNLEPGLAVRYFHGSWTALPDFDALDPVTTSTAQIVSLALADRDDHIGLAFDGYVSVPETGVYTFYTTSDDGSRLYIDGELVVDNDGLHGIHTEPGQAALEAGYHEIRVTFFERSGGEALSVSWEGPGFDKRPLEAESFFHAPM